VRGDRVDGEDRRRRLWLAAHRQASGLVGSGQESVWRDGRPRQGTTLLAAVPAAGWTRLRAGEGTPGPRWSDWRGRPLAAPVEPAWRRGRLGRRRLSPPTELTADGVVAAQAPTLEAVVPGAGRRGSIDSGVEAATGAGGWDPDDVRRWTGWDRPITLAR
jgi:hypothetical protein